MKINFTWLLGLVISIYSINSTALVTGFDTTPATNMSMPALNAPYIDPSYGTKVTRVMSASQVTDNNIPSWVRHEYSRRPAFNADSTRALALSSNGWIRLYSVNKANNTMTFMKTLSVGGAVEPNWHPTDPNKFYYLGTNGQSLKISEYNITNDQKTTVRDLGSRIKAIYSNASGMWTKEEGRPSNDGKIWCFQVENSSFSSLGIISYNFETDTILGHLDTNGDRPDHTSTSPKGNYCVPSWTGSKGTRAYALDFSSYTQLHTTSEHSDLALTKDGKEVYVYTDYGSGPDGGYVLMVDMATGSKTRLFELYGSNHSSTAIHISGIGTKKKPGYVVVGFYACRENYGNASCTNSQWFKEKIIIVDLKANPTIYNVAHTQYGNAGYWGETQAVANDDLTKILFVSSWRSSSESNLSSYMIDIPVGSLDGGSEPPVPQPKSCTFNGQSVVHGDDIRAYLTKSVPYGQDCVYQQRVCNDGNLSGSYTFATCFEESPPMVPEPPVPVPADCKFNGKTVAHGTKVTAFLNLRVPHGQQCKSEKRLCTNGQLSGSYKHSTCSVESAPPLKDDLKVNIVSLKRHSAYGAKVILKTNAAAKCRFTRKSGYRYEVLYDNFNSSGDGLTHNKTIGIGGREAVTGYAVCKKQRGQEQTEIKISVPAYTKRNSR